MKTKEYYCYKDKNELIISETKPEKFDTLPFNNIIKGPNRYFAKKIYTTNLKIDKWRIEK